MALNWNIKRVTNHETVCYKGKGDKRELRDSTSAIIFLTMAVGINEITAKNVDAFCVRLEVLKMLDVAKHGQAAPNTMWPTHEDVRAHIGLNTNASRMSEAKFMSYHCEALKLIAQNRVMYPSK